MAAAMIAAYVVSGKIESFEDFFADIVETSVKYGIYGPGRFCSIIAFHQDNKKWLNECNQESFMKIHILAREIANK